jgi:DNA mismatch endonuclease Vsr
MDVLTSVQRTKNMQAIKSKNTKIEDFLAKALWNKGLRYQRNATTIFGKPDIVFKGLKIAIFCDSEFFHGKDWDKLKTKIDTNAGFWIKKIEGNIERDKMVNKRLEEQGWLVLRFWGNSIIKNRDECVYLIETTINERKKK